MNGGIRLGLAGCQAGHLTERLRSFGIHERGFITDAESLDPERFVRETAVVGSPQTVSARLRELAEEMGSGTVNVNLGWMGAATEEAVRTGATLLVEEVLPALSRG